MRPDSQRQILGTKAVLLVAIPFAIGALTWGAAYSFRSWFAVSKAVAAAPVSEGRTVYLNNCARCHGEQGDGRGSTLLEPRARAFGLDKFKFASTTNGVPSDEDLLRCLDCGIP